MTQRTLTKKHYQRLEKIIAEQISFAEEFATTIKGSESFYYEKADKADTSSDSKHAFIMLNHAKTNRRFFKKKIKTLVDLQTIIKANIK
jgi:hypothetical protein